MSMKMCKDYYDQRIRMQSLEHFGDDLSCKLDYWSVHTRLYFDEKFYLIGSEFVYDFRLYCITKM